MCSRFSSVSSLTHYQSNSPSPSYITCITCSKSHKIQSVENLERNSSLTLLLNTLCCDVCHQINEFQKLDTCLHCYGVLCPQCYEKHQISDFHALTPKRKVTLEITASEKPPIVYQLTSSDNVRQLKQLRKRSSESVEENDDINQKILTEKIINIQQIISKKTLLLSTTTSPKDNQSSGVSNDENDNQSTAKIRLKKPLLKFIQRVRHSSSSSLTNLNISPLLSRKSNRVSSIKNDCNNAELSKITVQDSFIESQENVTLKISPTNSVRKFLDLNDHYKLTCEHVERCKQRVQELNLCTQKLIQIYKQKIDENQANIDFYWNLLKQTILAQIKHQSYTTSTKELLKYLICCYYYEPNVTNLPSSHEITHKQQLLEIYLENNDEINAALQVFYSNLIILINQTLSETSVDLMDTYYLTSQLFEREEKTALKSIRKELEQGLELYIEELSRIETQVKTEREYFLKWKNSNIIELEQIKEQWSTLVDVTYPKLIEKISTDFIQIKPANKIIATMLKHIKQRIQQKIQQLQEETFSSNLEC
ncbi:unnamed protein product [Didymodactylos carnosus]|uniref:Uncharacterized protein n=1 Tax=Didymodactylos carnosus TaxID=1234261 RepID=A0A814LEU1_9BILA|nr:unnamed protein product [Didymodactylos carnosus]CAF3832972.1 unnamed protein product [Didymodactylos carnosus]